MLSDRSYQRAIAQAWMLALLIGSACETPLEEREGPAPLAETTRPAIPPDRAIALVLERYQQLFASLYFRDNRDGSYHGMPTPAAKEFRVHDDGNAWEVACGGLRGTVIHARVDKAGNWVEFTDVGYALR